MQLCLTSTLCLLTAFEMGTSGGGESRTWEWAAAVVVNYLREEETETCIIPSKVWLYAFAAAA